jgi:hypothetical protein
MKTLHQLSGMEVFPNHGQGAQVYQLIQLSRATLVKTKSIYLDHF